MKQQDENRIWDYVDGFLTEAQKAEVEYWVSTNTEARQLLTEVRALKIRLDELLPEKPSAGFTMNVLGAFAAETGKIEINTQQADNWIIKSIVGAFMAIILVLIGLVVFLGSGNQMHQVQQVSNGLASAGSGDIIHLMGNKFVTRSFLIAEVLMLLFFAEKLIKRFTLKKGIA
jgi:anti-sigma factor RsiW